MSVNSFYADRALLKRPILGHVTTDTPVAIRLRYVGTGTVTSITTTTATNIVMITSDGGTDTYAFATYTTVGSLVDAINKDGIFEAIVLDSLRSYATASQFVTGAITASTHIEGYSIWDVLVDTSAAYYFAFCADPANRGFFQLAKSKSHRVNLREIKYYIDMGTAAADSVQLWERNGTVETQVNGWLSVDATATTINLASANVDMYSALEGNQLIALVKDAGALADATTNYLDVSASIE
jgi:hypothetical protein